ncbi:MAG: hypothetical protein ABSC88_11855 [Terracidiphilus sp.]|jgi:hypothetical protein
MPTSEDKNAKGDVMQGLLGYFDQHVLASYRNEPQKYTIASDSFEGTLEVTKEYSEELERTGRDEGYLNIQFGYRTLQDGELALVVWLPDLEKATAHQAKWIAFHLANPQWTSEIDERFENWVNRYIYGSFDVDNGPKHYLIQSMKIINGLTSEMVGLPLYRHVADETLGFPSAQNTHRYQDAHSELYGCLIDGLDKKCISKLAEALKVNISVDSEKTVKSIKTLFPELGAPSNFDSATTLVSEQRRLSTHAKRPTAKSFPAFETYTKDLTLCVQALKDLIQVLENKLGVNAELAYERHEAKRVLPKIVRPIGSNFLTAQASRLQGKTVERVEYGFREDWAGVHGSESLILHFTDGSIASIDTGSNAFNLASDRSDLRPEDFNVDFRIHWVPSLTDPQP